MASNSDHRMGAIAVVITYIALVTQRKQLAGGLTPRQNGVKGLFKFFQ